jgi:hypothetical protein
MTGEAILYSPEAIYTGAEVAYSKLSNIKEKPLDALAVMAAPGSVFLSKEYSDKLYPKLTKGTFEMGLAEKGGALEVAKQVAVTPIMTDVVYPALFTLGTGYALGGLAGASASAIKAGGGVGSKLLFVGTTKLAPWAMTAAYVAPTALQTYEMGKLEWEGKVPTGTTAGHLARTGLQFLSASASAGYGYKLGAGKTMPLIQRYGSQYALRKPYEALYQDKGYITRTEKGMTRFGKGEVTKYTPEGDVVSTEKFIGRPGSKLRLTYGKTFAKGLKEPIIDIKKPIINVTPGPKGKQIGRTHV